MRKLLCALLGMLLAGTSWSATLPAGYTQLEYIEATDLTTTYINTGVSFSNCAKVVIQLEEINYGSDGTIFVSGGRKTPYLGIYRNGGLASNALTSPNYTVTGNTITFTWAGTSYEGNVNIFGWTASSWSAEEKLQLVQLYDSNDVLLFNGIPARRISDSAVGMYDTVSGTFFTNAGTGTFVAGPVFAGGGGVVDLGSLTWNKANNTGRFYGTVSDGKHEPDSVNIYAKGLIAFSFNDRTDAWATELSIFPAFHENRVFVQDARYTDATAFKQAMSGVYLYYQRTTDETWTSPTTTPIKIATTAYNSAHFSPVVTELNTTIATIRNVVTNTINQTKAIADLQATKQTRPNENCPAGKKCLLVEDNDGTPHWFEIVENAD